MFRRSTNLSLRLGADDATHRHVFKRTFQNREKCESFISLHGATTVEDFPCSVCSNEMMVFYNAFDSGFE